MIKKYLLWLWISLFWFVWFWYCFPDLISVVPWEAYNWDNIYVDNFSLSTDLTFTKPVTYINSNLNVEYAFYWDQYWYLHFFVNDTNWKSDYIINSYVLTNWSWSYRELSQSEFINYVNNHSVYKVDFYFWYSCQNGYNYWTTFSIHFDNWNYIYFAWWVCQWNNLYVTPWGWPKQSPTNWTIAWLVSYNSPFWNNNYNPWEIENITWNIVQVPTDIDRYIQYYESKYWWDENVCYVWTDDLTGAYWKPWLTFQYWSGATMFSLYYLMYWTFWQSPVKNVWHFLNCWLLNYNQWWDTISDERSYLCNYIWPSEWSVLSYDVTENPFKNNRAAIYFLIDNLYNHQYRIDTSSPMFESSMGDEYAFYCAAKLNYENYKNWTLDFSELENQIDPILKDIIWDWNNRNLWSQYWFSVPNMSWNDNIWWNLIQTWSWIPDDLNPSWLFKQFYDRINSLLQNFSPRVAFWFIPLWILYPMLFLILFRILKH